MPEFPYGKAPFWIMLVAVLSGAALFVSARREEQRRPDLVFATFAEQHYKAYLPVVREFEQRRGVKIQMQLVHSRALESRLQSAMQVGADVPDMVELLTGSLGFFTRGPLEDVGFVDLTDKLHETGLYDRLVTNRFGVWSSRGRIFALPHDVHPVALAYRKDILDELGIDPDRDLTTWADFVRVGREKVTKDLDGDGIIDRYMIDLPSDGGDALPLLLRQRGGGLFDESGNVIFDSEIAIDTVVWYAQQVEPPTKIAFPAGWGQNLATAMRDGLAVFYFCPDWRTWQFQTDVASLAGKMRLMPLPAWEPGGPRTSSWGGTGLGITKACKNPELAWEFAMFLYYQKEELGKRFETTYIIPPLKEAWALPEFQKEIPFYGGQKVGDFYASMAPQVPAEWVNAFTKNAETKFREAFNNTRVYYAENGDQGLREFATAELKRTADRVRLLMNRNVFLSQNKMDQTNDADDASNAPPSPGTPGEGGGEGSRREAPASLTAPVSRSASPSSLSAAKDLASTSEAAATWARHVPSRSRRDPSLRSRMPAPPIARVEHRGVREVLFAGARRHVPGGAR
jgi:arabinosaccharide transport system substrate-binding protein